MPYLTIIVPTRQAEKTLAASLDSILRQEFTNFEVLVMDSLSTDGTLTIAKQFADTDSRVRVFSAPDKGVYDAMNKGIRQACGKWLYFLGSDDFLYDEKVLASVFAGPGHKTCQLLYGNVVSPSYRGIYDGKFSYGKLLSRNLSHQAAFYHHSLFQRLGDYNLRYRAYADWDFNIRCFADDKVCIEYIHLVIARFGPDGLSSRHDVLFLRESLFLAKLRFIEQTGTRVLRRLDFYDEWWRLLRNAGFRQLSELTVYAGDTPIPAVIAAMATMQKNVSQSVLRVGICSKILMFVSYLRHLLIGVI